jgi:hypothetical protein
MRSVARCIPMASFRTTFASAAMDFLSGECLVATNPSGDFELTLTLRHVTYLRCEFAWYGGRRYVGADALRMLACVWAPSPVIIQCLYAATLRDSIAFFSFGDAINGGLHSQFGFSTHRDDCAFAPMNIEDEIVHLWSCTLEARMFGETPLEEHFAALLRRIQSAKYSTVEGERYIAEMDFINEMRAQYTASRAAHKELLASIGSAEEDLEASLNASHDALVYHLRKLSSDRLRAAHLDSL